jgi:hypothetical protein
MKPFTATDDKGRKIECFSERTIPAYGVDYSLLTPIDTPVVLVRIGEGDEDDELIEDLESAGEILAVADVCLAGHSLTLVRSAVTLTVSGKLLPVESEEIEDDDADLPEEEDDLFELLISFQHNGQEYGLYIPLDPFFVVARVTGDSEGVVVTGDEFEPIRPIIEAELNRREQDT